MTRCCGKSRIGKKYKKQVKYGWNSRLSVRWLSKQVKNNEYSVHRNTDRFGSSKEYASINFPIVCAVLALDSGTIALESKTWQPNICKIV